MKGSKALGIFFLSMLILLVTNIAGASQEPSASIIRTLDKDSLLLNEDESFFFTDGRNPSLFVKTNEGVEKLAGDTPSFPMVSPNKGQLAYIAPFIWDEIGELYIFTAETNSTQKVMAKSYLPANCTPKSIVWLDDRYLTVIVGDAYSKTSVGGDVYIVDSQTGTTEILYQTVAGQEVQDVKVSNQIPILELVTFNSDASDYLLEIKTLQTFEVQRIKEQMEAQ